jgi:transcriptional regulator with XRE-family HTH domain
MEESQSPLRLIGARLLALRERADVTQDVVCEAVSITKSYLSRLEQDRHTAVSLEVSGRLARYYGVSLDYLTGRTDKETLDPDDVGTADMRIWQVLPAVP